MSTDQARLSEDYGGPGPAVPTSLWKWLSNEGRKNMDGVALIATHQSSDHLSQSVPSTSPSSSTSRPYLEWTYRQLLDAVEKLAATWHHAGVQSGDTLAAFLDNNNAAEWTLLFWTAIRLGVTFVPLEPLILDRHEELELLLTTLSPAVIVVQNNKQSEALNKMSIATKIKFACPGDQEAASSRWPDFRKMPKAMTKNPPAASDTIDPLSTALIMFTSGSTNLPKGCPVTAKGLVAQTSQYHSLYGSNFDTSTRHLISTMCFRPICYLGCLNTWTAGGTVVFSHSGFDSENTIRTINDLQITHAWFVPAMINMLNSSDAVSQLPSPNSLNTLFMSGDAASAEIARKGQGLLQPSRMIAHWGMSEGAPVFGFTRDEPPPTDPDSGTLGLGRALAGTRLKICKADTYDPVPRGEHGELHICSDATITRYLENRSADDFYDGNQGGRWFKTGDTAMMNNEGIVFVVGRTKDIIVSKGFNVVPALLEDRLKKEFEVEAVVVGIPHEVYGEVPAAVVKEMPDGDNEPVKENMLQHVSKTLGEQHAIKGGVMELSELGMKDWPYNSSNKMQKSEIVDAIIGPDAKKK